MERQPEKRRYRRHKSTLEIRLRVTGTGRGKPGPTLKGNMLNLSLSGARVRVWGLTQEQASGFLQARHKCSLIFTLPMQTRETVLKGEIAWVEIRPDDTADLGIELGRMIEDEDEILGHYADTVF